MEKQYSTHPEKYKQHWFIDIYNFEITVSKTQSTAQQQNCRVTDIFTNARFVLPEHMFLSTKLSRQHSVHPPVSVGGMSLQQKVYKQNYFSLS